MQIIDAVAKAGIVEPVKCGHSSQLQTDGLIQRLL
jgi:hypothetical protein